MRVEMRAGSDKECSSADGRLWGGSADNVWDVVVVELRELPAILVELEAPTKLLDEYLNQDRSSRKIPQAWLGVTQTEVTRCRPKRISALKAQ